MDMIILIRTFAVLGSLAVSLILFVRQKREPSAKRRTAAIAAAVVFLGLLGFSRLSVGYAYYGPSVYRKLTGGDMIVYSIDGETSRFIVTSAGRAGTVPLEDAGGDIIKLKRMDSDVESAAEFPENGCTAFADLYCSADGTDSFVRIYGHFEPSAQINDSLGTKFSEKRKDTRSDLNGRQYISGDYAAYVPGLDKESYTLTVGGTSAEFE